MVPRHNFQTLTIYFLLITLSSMASFSAMDDSESEALLTLKLSLKDAAKALASWKSGTAACRKKHQWVGVACLRNGQVAGIRLNRMKLSGEIDVNALTKIPGLRSLNLAFNNFSGPIPELNKLGALKAIYLNGNQFSGEIEPDYFSKMDSLKKLWLAGNKFTGPIPVSLVEVPNLVELHLEGNRFSGLIPPLEQPSLVSLDVSRNNLSGKIPLELSRKKTLSARFEGNQGLCGEIFGKPCNTSSLGLTADQATKSIQNPANHIPGNGEELEHEHFNKVAAFGFFIATIIILLLMIIGILALRRQQLQEECEFMENSDLSVKSVIRILDEDQVQAHDHEAHIEVKEESTKPITWSGILRPRGPNKAGDDIVMVNDNIDGFRLADLMRASAEVLGNGDLGTSYKATLGNGITVVAKRIKEMNELEKDELDCEIKRFGRLKHKNVLAPLAYNFRKEEKLLICEYVTRGCLLHQLQGGNESKLNYPTRLKIIQGISQGLLYLHTELSSLEIPHGNLKSSNVLLSPENEPLLTDYGFSGLISEQARESCLFAYKSPEFVKHQKISPKSDVFCLGVLIIEILAGKVDSGSEGGGEVEELLRIGGACKESDPDRRLDVGEAARRIEEVISMGNSGLYEEASLVIDAGTPSP